MAKKASPWFWEARNGWYVLLNGQRHLLGDHPADAARPQKSKEPANGTRRHRSTRPSTGSCKAGRRKRPRAARAWWLF